MPFGDGTGPMGYGPMTGRGAGYCAGYSVPGYMNPWGGRGVGWGRGGGRGRGWRNRYYATGAPGWAGYGAWPGAGAVPPAGIPANNPFFERSEEHTSELQSRPHLVCRLLLEKK